MGDHYNLVVNYVVQIYDYIVYRFSPSTGNHHDSHNDQLPVDLIDQLAEHSSDYIGFAEVKVEIPFRPEIFRSPLPID